MPLDLSGLWDMAPESYGVSVGHGQGTLSDRGASALSSFMTLMYTMRIYFGKSSLMLLHLLERGTALYLFRGERLRRSCYTTAGQLRQLSVSARVPDFPGIPNLSPIPK